MHKIFCIGTKSDIAHNKFTGQSVMFDGIVGKLLKDGNKVTIIDISSRFNSKSVLLRSLDYAIVILKVFSSLLSTRYNIGYITTAQSKKGFLRDNVIVGLMRLFKVNVVAHQYGANYHQLTDALSDKGMKKLKRMLDYISVIIVEGEHMKEQYSFLEGYENKVKVIPNGLPVVGKNAMHPKSFNGDVPFRMYYLSNLIWSKGYFDVLKAVDLLVNKYDKKVECVFAGKFMVSADDEHPGISNKDDFDKFVEGHHLTDVVSYYPGMYGEQKDEMFAKANVFLLPTYYINEGQPVSIIEAMAYGCVPIVTEYRHIPMMVNNENGCFVDPKNPNQIANTIVRLMEHPDEYAAKSAASIRDYKDKFTFDKYASQVLQCMNEVVNS